MKEFWVLIGGDVDTMATLIRTWAVSIETVREAWPNATRILQI